MPQITDRSTKEPLLDLIRLGHGTLTVANLAKSRRFYEEVLGLEVIQTSPLAMMIKLGTAHTYAVVEIGEAALKNKTKLGHNGFDVGSREAVDDAYEKLVACKDEYELTRIEKPRQQHGDYSFYFIDRDGNWWEIGNAGEGGYEADFEDPFRDLTGRHYIPAVFGPHFHTHDFETREKVRALAQAADAHAQPQGERRTRPE